MTYTVNQLAKLAGVSVATLHYYDEIGLLKPSYIKENGYRVYGQKEIEKLEQILFFRELEFPLAKIRQIMESSGYDEVAVLSDQKKLLELKKQRIEKLIQAITKSITTAEGGEFMTTDDSFSVFNDPTYKKYKDEVEGKWGGTAAYRQSMERVGKMSKAQFEQVKKEGGEITVALASLMNKGIAATSQEAQELIGKYYKHLKHFYEPNLEMYKALGQGYVDDVRFKAFYEKIAPGLAEYMRDAIVHFANTQSK